MCHSGRDLRKHDVFTLTFPMAQPNPSAGSGAGACYNCSVSLPRRQAGRCAPGRRSASLSANELRASNFIMTRNRRGRILPGRLFSLLVLLQTHVGDRRAGDMRNGGGNKLFTTAGGNRMQSSGRHRGPARIHDADGLARSMTLLPISREEWSKRPGPYPTPSMLWLLYTACARVRGFPCEFFRSPVAEMGDQLLAVHQALCAGGAYFDLQGSNGYRGRL